MKRIIAVLMLFILAVVSAGCYADDDDKSSVEKSENEETVAEKSSPVEITVFSVGKADAILVRVDESYMMIDCGEISDAGYVLSELEKRGIKRLDVLEITHFDKDHVGGAAQVVQNTETGRIIYPDYEGERSEYFAFMESIKDHSAAGAITEVTSFKLGTADVTVYPADDPEALIDGDKEYDNEMSLVTRIEYGGKVFLFCGDAEKKRLKQMCGSDVDWKCDWIKLPHHGIYSKKLAEFLELCSPAYSVMTVSEYEPADDETKDLLASLGTESYDTLGGDVVTSFDGSTITVTVQKIEK